MSIQAAVASALAKLRPWRRPDVVPRAVTGDRKHAGFDGTRVRREEDLRTSDRLLLVPRRDRYTLADYDVCRHYPVVSDALFQLTQPLSRCEMSFRGSTRAVALAEYLLRSKLTTLVQTLLKGGMEFGHQMVEIRWTPRFDVRVPVKKSVGNKDFHVFPYAYDVARWASLSPFDTRMYVYQRTGDFAGARQMAGRVREKDRYLHHSKLLLFSYQPEFDYLTGVPRTRKAIPFVNMALDTYSDMALYSRLFAVPIKVLRHPEGHLKAVQDGDGMARVTAADYALQILEQAQAGADVALPSTTKDGKELWSMEFHFAPPEGASGFVARLDHLNSVIRIALAMPEMASSQAPDSGTYNLGQVQIQTWLDSMEAVLVPLEEVCNDFMARWTFANFGPSEEAVRVSLRMDMQTKRALLAALLNLLTSGQPVTDAEGNELAADWSAVAEENGLQIIQQNVSSVVSQLKQMLAQQPPAAATPPPDPGGPPPAANNNAAAPADAPELPTLDGDATAPVELAEWRESDHPRDEDGKFASKDGAASNAPRHVSHAELKQAKVVQQAAWTRGRLPNIIEHDGQLWRVSKSAHPTPAWDQSNANAVNSQAERGVQEAVRRRVQALKWFMADGHTREEAERLAGESTFGQRAREMVEELMDEREPGFLLTPAVVNDIMPKLREKLAERKHAPYLAMVRGQLTTSSGTEVSRLVSDDGQYHVAVLQSADGFQVKEQMMRQATGESVGEWKHDRAERRARQQAMSSADAAYHAAQARSSRGDGGGVVQQPGESVSAEGKRFTEERMDPREIKVKPGMQYKVTEITDRENATSDSLDHVEAYDQATAGPLTVWRDKTGETFVMNGHHRRKLAIRTGQASVPVRVFHESDGVTFETAKALGALQNIRDGKGTALDAAAVLNELGFTMDQLKRAGVNLRSGVGQNAVSLMKLAPSAMALVRGGMVPEVVAAGIADAELPPMKQTIAINKASQGELDSRRQGELLAHQLKALPVVVKDDGSGNLFGDVISDIPLAEMAKVEEAAGKALARNASLFAKLTKGLAVGGTTIDEQAQMSAAEAQQWALMAMRTDSQLRSAIIEAAKRYAEEPGSFRAGVDKVLRAAAEAGERKQAQLKPQQPTFCVPAMEPRPARWRRGICISLGWKDSKSSRKLL